MSFLLNGGALVSKHAFFITVTTLCEMSMNVIIFRFAAVVVLGVIITAMIASDGNKRIKKVHGRQFGATMTQ